MEANSPLKSTLLIIRTLAHDGHKTLPTCTKLCWQTWMLSALFHILLVKQATRAKRRHFCQYSYHYIKGFCCLGQGSHLTTCLFLIAVQVRGCSVDISMNRQKTDVPLRHQMLRLWACSVPFNREIWPTHTIHLWFSKAYKYVLNFKRVAKSHWKNNSQICT